MKDNAATNEVKDMIFIWLSFPVSLLFKLCDSLALKRRWEKIKIKFKKYIYHSNEKDNWNVNIKQD